MFEVRNLEVAYGRIRVLFGVSLALDKGEAVAVIGPNGAGKSSLVSAVAGFATTVGGQVVLDGRDLTRCGPHERSRAGIGLVPSGRWLFKPLTVELNLKLGQNAAGSTALDLDFVYELFPVLSDRRKQIASTLSGGEQQMLAIGRALLSKPSILILDEPSLGLAPIIVQRLYESLGQLKERGQTLLIVEEKTEYALSLCDRYVVMTRGRVVHEGTTSQGVDASVLRESYLG